MQNNTGRLLICILLSFVCGDRLFADPDYIWNINESGLFDSTNKAYAAKDGIVTVDLKEQSSRFPTGLGHLASGREPVKDIRILFENEADRDYWLHISWNPGGSGREQFEVFYNSSSVGKSCVADAGEKPNQSITEKFKVKLDRGNSSITIRHLSGDGLRFKYVFLSRSDKEPLTPLLNPDLKFPTLGAYEAECKEPGILLDDTRMQLFAPKKRAKEAKIVFAYLVKAYGQLYRLVGMHPEYKLVVYHFPKGNKHGWGGTSNCTIWYSYKNLEFESQQEWREYGVPHLSGYIEEMAHNFDGATGAQFGWEMIGWNLGAKVTKKVAGNPLLVKQIKDTRAVQRETFQRYSKTGYVFPENLPGNLSDRIHGHILWRCKNRYGASFWRDFFKEIRKEQEGLKESVYLRDPDKIRNRRYQITVECFDRLPRIDFKELLKDNQLSLTTAIKSLNPTKPDWNRKFLGPDELTMSFEGVNKPSKNAEQPVSVDLERLPQLHKAAYGGHGGKVGQLIKAGSDVRAKGPNGWTPLHMAAMGGHQLVATILLDNGADIHAKDNQGRTPAEVAKVYGHSGTAVFLRTKESGNN